MMLRRYHNVKQEVQAVEKPPVKPADVVEETVEQVDEKSKTRRRSKKSDVE